MHYNDCATRAYKDETMSASVIRSRVLRCKPDFDQRLLRMRKAGIACVGLLLLDRIQRVESKNPIGFNPLNPRIIVQQASGFGKPLSARSRQAPKPVNTYALEKEL